MTVGLWFLALAHGGILVGAAGPDATGEAPKLGETVTLTVTDEAAHPLPGQTVRVVHRPGLGLEQEQAIGITDAQGTVEWSPAAAGLARVRAGSQVQAFEVEGPFPLATWAYGALIVLIALGSIAWGVRSGAPVRARR